MARKVLGRDLSGLLSGARPARWVDRAAHDLFSPEPLKPNSSDPGSLPAAEAVNGESNHHGMENGHGTSLSIPPGWSENLGPTPFSHEPELRPGLSPDWMTVVRRWAPFLAADLVMLLLAAWLVMGSSLSPRLAYSLAALCVALGGASLLAGRFLARRVPSRTTEEPGQLSGRPGIHIHLTRM